MTSLIIAIHYAAVLFLSRSVVYLNLNLFTINFKIFTFKSNAFQKILFEIFVKKKVPIVVVLIVGKTSSTHLERRQVLPTKNCVRLKFPKKEINDNFSTDCLISLDKK